MKNAGFRLLLIGAMAAGLASCATSIIPYRAEHRYRIFYSTDPAFDFGAPIDAAAIESKFVPKESVALTLKQFGEEGFALKKVEQVAYSKGAAVFTFSRQVSNSRARTPAAPPDVAGIYEVETPDGSIYYALYPEAAPFYSVHAIGPMNVISARAEWDGVQLSWEENGQARHAIPDRDPRYMKFISGAASSQIGTQARRIEEIHQYTPAEYTELKFLRRLRPETLGVEQGW